MESVLQKSLPFAPWMDPLARRLPGTRPLDPSAWLVVDDAYAGQMALRDRLVREAAPSVHALLPEAGAAARELFATVLARLPALGFARAGGAILRPDGVAVTPDPAAPLLTLGRLVQEDFCLLQPGPGGEHRLTGAILCFPAGWTLAEKIGRPLMRIHAPIPAYDPDIGRRVQRMFDAIRPEAPVWRANAHLSAAPLHNPRSEADPRLASDTALPYVRSERQTILRLPESRAIIFSIHTWLVRVDDLMPAQREGLAAAPIHAAH